MKNSLFQVAKRHRVQRCLFSLFCLCAAWALPFAASGYTILHDDYGKRVGYERTGLTNTALTVAIRYLDWNENATDKSLVKFGLKNGKNPEMVLGADNMVLGRWESGTNTSTVVLSLSHDGGMLFFQQDNLGNSGLNLYSSTGEQICHFGYGWNSKKIESLCIGSLFTLQDVTIFDSCLTAQEMAVYASGAQNATDLHWSNFAMAAGGRFVDSEMEDLSINFSVTNYVSLCDISSSRYVRIATLGIAADESGINRNVPATIVLRQNDLSVTGMCTVVASGATLKDLNGCSVVRDLLLASFTDFSVKFETSRTVAVSFHDKYRNKICCSCTCIRSDDGYVNPRLKLDDKMMPVVDVCGIVMEGENVFSPVRQWVALNGVSVSRSYVDTWLPKADWATPSGQEAICASLVLPRAASEYSNGYSLLDSWALGLDPTNAASVVRLNLKQDTSTTFKLGFENVKTNREAFVRQSFSIKHAATLEALESAEYDETGSEMTVPLDGLESVQFYRGKISFDPL